MNLVCCMCGIAPAGVTHLCVGIAAGAREVAPSPVSTTDGAPLPNIVIGGPQADWFDKAKHLTEISQLKDELRQVETVLSRVTRDRDQYREQLSHVQGRCTEILDQYRELKRAGIAVVESVTEDVLDSGLDATFYDCLEDLRHLVEPLEDRLKRSVEAAKQKPPTYLGSFAKYVDDE